eukprot:290623-Pleurochrysis_carterae.AAC.1
MRTKIKDALVASGLVVSFVDLGMDATKVPTVTERGVGKSEVRVTAPRDYLARLSPENSGRGASVEERLGYPQMYATSNAARKAGTKPTTAGGGGGGRTA